MPHNKVTPRPMRSLPAMWRSAIQLIALTGLPIVLLLLNRYYGDITFYLAAVLLPGLWILLRHASATTGIAAKQPRSALGLMQPDVFSDAAHHVLEKAKASKMKSAVFSIEVDNHETFIELYGHSGAENIARTLGRRLVSVMRDDDAVGQTGEFSFAVCLEPVRQLDLEVCIQLAGRMQTAIEDPIPMDGTTVYVTGCVGFAQYAEASVKSAEKWRDMAGVALVDARRNGAGSIRAFSREMQNRSEARAELRREIAAALSNGQIRPWFQPQISTDTGRVTGFEALARWHHPTKGLIPPIEFLETIETAGLLERLAEVMIYCSFTALKAWDKSGVKVPQVGVNFAGPELNNPNLAEKIKWELDRFDLTPERLSVEVLETVISNAPDDVVSRNIKSLSDMGCGIDLDDFGTGHTSITSLRRFAVNRIKIDRSFVMKSDRDPEQQRMIGAILTMAERLNIETLAEGVETVGEHALLAQLGCDHVQGYGIAKPMPFDKTIEWMSLHNAKLQSTEQIMGNKLR